MKYPKTGPPQASPGNQAWLKGNDYTSCHAMVVAEDGCERERAQEKEKITKQPLLPVYTTNTIVAWT